MTKKKILFLVTITFLIVTGIHSYYRYNYFYQTSLKNIKDLNKKITREFIGFQPERKLIDKNLTPFTQSMYKKYPELGLIIIIDKHENNLLVGKNNSYFPTQKDINLFQEKYMQNEKDLYLQKGQKISFNKNYFYVFKNNLFDGNLFLTFPLKLQSELLKKFIIETSLLIIIVFLLIVIIYNLIIPPKKQTAEKNKEKRIKEIIKELSIPSNIKQMEIYILQKDIFYLYYRIANNKMVKTKRTLILDKKIQTEIKQKATIIMNNGQLLYYPLCQNNIVIGLLKIEAFSNFTIENFSKESLDQLKNIISFDFQNAPKSKTKKTTEKSSLRLNDFKELCKKQKYGSLLILEIPIFNNLSNNDKNLICQIIQNNFSTDEKIFLEKNLFFIYSGFLSLEYLKQKLQKTFNDLEGKQNLFSTNIDLKIFIGFAESKNIPNNKDLFDIAIENLRLSYLKDN